MLSRRGRWQRCALGLVFAQLDAACFVVKVDPGDTPTTISTVSETVTMTAPTTFEPTTDPPTTTGPTTITPTNPTITDPTTFGPTTTTITDPTLTDPTIDPTFTVTTEPPADCGNGVVEAGEECDDGNDIDSDACTTNCKDAVCGDGFVRAGFEVCDDGINDNSYEGCAPGCSALGPRCGDGILQGGEGELCDDGNLSPGDGCFNCVGENLPPECVQAQLLASPTRNVTFQTDTVACDLDLPEAGQWSRFVGSAGQRMPSSAPPMFSCGTHAPGWLDGTAPTEGQGVVTRQVCFHWEDDLCRFSVEIGVRNCGAFLAYRLPAVPACALRYCGVD